MKADFKDDDVNFLVKHFSHDPIVLGFLIPSFSVEAINCILENMPNGLKIPSYHEVCHTVASQTVYKSFTEKNEHYTRKYTHEQGSLLSYYYPQTNELSFYLQSFYEKNKLDKSMLNSSLEVAKKRTQKI